MGFILQRLKKLQLKNQTKKKLKKNVHKLFQMHNVLSTFSDWNCQKSKSFFVILKDTGL